MHIIVALKKNLIHLEKASVDQIILTADIVNFQFFSPFSDLFVFLVESVPSNYLDIYGIVTQKQHLPSRTHL